MLEFCLPYFWFILAVYGIGALMMVLVVVRFYSADAAGSGHAVTVGGEI